MDQTQFKIHLSGLRPYTVHYRDCENQRLEGCFYACDAYEARLLAMEFNRYINDLPNCIDLIRRELTNNI